MADKTQLNEKAGRKSFASLSSILPPIAFALVALIAAWLPVGYHNALPQLASGDPLAVLFGDIRVILGNKFIDKADEYFHGGIKHVHCLENLQSQGHDHGKEHAHVHEHSHQEEQEADPIWDPWKRISAGVHPPHVDRHLAGKTTRELLPWLWAACKISKDSVRAYLDAAYVLFALYEKPDKALMALEEGIERNPKSPDLEFLRGNVLTHELDQPEEGEKAFRKALEKSRGIDTEEARLLRIRALGYLGVFAARREDALSLRAYLQEARLIAPEHYVTKKLEEQLKACPAVIPLP